MRDLNELNDHRVRGLSVVKMFGWEGGADCGAFMLSSPLDGMPLRVIASSGDGWDHVSVSRPDACPQWEEMEFIKRLFFKPFEPAMQLHVPPADHKNLHPYCLHLWRPTRVPIPLPPSSMVAP